MTCLLMPHMLIKYAHVLIYVGEGAWHIHSQREREDRETIKLMINREEKGTRERRIMKKRPRFMLHKHYTFINNRSSNVLLIS